MTVSVENDLSGLLKELRRRHRYSIRQLAAASGVSHTYLGLLERGADPRTGKPIQPSPKVLERIGKVLGDSYTELIAAAGYLPKEEVRPLPIAALPPETPSPRGVVSPTPPGRTQVPPYAFEVVARLIDLLRSPEVPDQKKDFAAVAVSEAGDWKLMFLHRALASWFESQPVSASSVSADELLKTTQPEIPWFELLDIIPPEEADTALQRLGLLYSRRQRIPVVEAVRKLLETNANPSYACIRDAFAHQYEGQLDRAIEAYEDALRSATDPLLIADVDRNLGKLYSYSYQYPRAFAHLLRAVPQLERTLEPREKGRLYLELGWLSHLTDHGEDAIRYFNRAIEILEPTEHLKQLRSAYEAVATTRSKQAHFSEALEYDEKALELAEKEDDEDRAWALGSLGIDYMYVGQLKEAQRCLEEALLIAEEKESKAQEAMLNNELAHLYVMLGDPDAALRYCERGLAINREGGFVWGMAYSYEFLSSVYSAKGEVVKALGMNMEATARFFQLGYKYRLAMCYAEASELFLALRAADQALSYAKRALKYAQEGRYPLEQGIAHRLIGMAYSHMGQWVEAWESLAKSEHILEGIGEEPYDVPYELAKTYEQLGRYYMARGDRNSARKYLNKAIAKAQRIGAAQLLEQCASALDEIRAMPPRESEEVGRENG